MRFPFGLSPKAKETGPFYVDLYARSVAAAIDVGILFTVLNGLFESIAQYIRARVITTTATVPDKAITVSQFIQLLHESHFLQFWIINFTIQIAILGLVVISCQIAFGTTPGKWIMGIKIVKAETFETPSPWQFILRFFGYIVAVIPLMIGILWISFNKQRRGWHDRIAGTVVLDQRPPGWYWKKIKQGWRYLTKKEPKEELPPTE